MNLNRLWLLPSIIAIAGGFVLAYTAVQLALAGDSVLFPGVLATLSYAICHIGFWFGKISVGDIFQLDGD